MSIIKIIYESSEGGSCTNTHDSEEHEALFQLKVPFYWKRKVGIILHICSCTLIIKDRQLALITCTLLYKLYYITICISLYFAANQPEPPQSAGKVFNFVILEESKIFFLSSMMVLPCLQISWTGLRPLQC